MARERNLTLVERTITARIAVHGTHHWPDAPDRRAYLRERHPHTFGIAVTVPVEHDDRAVEFHDLADLMHSAVLQLYGPFAGLGPRSCERMADEVVRAVAARLPHDITWLRCEVDEDGQHSSSVTLQGEVPF